MALQFISGAAPPKQAEENQLLEIGKKLFLKNWIFEWCTGRKGGLLYQWIGHWLLWLGRLLLKSREVYLIWFQNVLRRSQILAFVPVIHVLYVPATPSVLVGSWCCGVVGWANSGCTGKCVWRQKLVQTPRVRRCNCTENSSAQWGVPVMWSRGVFNHSQLVLLCWSRTAWMFHPGSYVSWNLRFQDSLGGAELLHREEATALLWKCEQSWVWKATHWTLPSAWRSWMGAPGSKQTWKFCHLMHFFSHFIREYSRTECGG